MDPQMSILIMLCISFPEAMLMAYFAIQFMGGKPKLVDVIIIGLIQAVVAYFVRILPIPVGLHSILLGVSYIILIHFVARISFWVSSVGVVLGLIVLLLQEILVSQVIIQISGITIQSIINNTLIRIAVYTPVLMGFLLVILLLNRYEINFERITKSKAIKSTQLLESGDTSRTLYKEHLPAVIFIFLPIFILFLLNFAFVSVTVDISSSYDPNLFRILFNVLIILLAFVSIWALRRISRAVQKEYEATKAAETIEQLKDLILSIRKQRHDFNHHLQTIFGLMQTGSFEKAMEYIEKTYHYVSGTGELIKTDNPNISALLYAKIGIAETRNIKFDICIECSLGDFPLNSNESSSLLGNLVDNAFEAIEKNNAEDRVVKLDITAERGMYLISVSNRGEIDRQLRSEIFKNSYTTKEGHSGLGLTIVKEIVDKYRGNIDVFSEEGNTIFKIDIPFRR